MNRGLSWQFLCPTGTFIPFDFRIFISYTEEKAKIFRRAPFNKRYRGLNSPELSKDRLEFTSTRNLFPFGNFRTDINVSRFAFTYSPETAVGGVFKVGASGDMGKGTRWLRDWDVWIGSVYGGMESPGRRGGGGGERKKGGEERKGKSWKKKVEKYFKNSHPSPSLGPTTPPLFILSHLPFIPPLPFRAQAAKSRDGIEVWTI